MQLICESSVFEFDHKTSILSFLFKQKPYGRNYLLSHLSMINFPDEAEKTIDLNSQLKSNTLQKTLSLEDLFK
jgi:hypothetical protein